MLKKTIKFTDYNGEEQSKDFYFNLTKAELAEMDLRHNGGFETYIHRIIDAKDNETLVDVFKEIIFKSYGEKDPTGLRFVKSKELSEAFSQTEAYSELFMELITDADKASAFMNGIIPKIDSKPVPTLSE